MRVYGDNNPNADVCPLVERKFINTAIGNIDYSWYILYSVQIKYTVCSIQIKYAVYRIQYTVYR
jgi:hypothetical protein